MSSQPHPIGSLRLFGLDDHRTDTGLSVGLLLLVVCSRLAAFPVSIWEQDEALFAGAVLHFDPTDNLPHPPWFPLWIALGRLVHLVGIDAATSLQWVSFVASVWILFPLTSLWSTVLPRRLATGAAVLFLVAPGPWLLSGRAFTGTTATALLVAALAFWLGAGDRPRWSCAGSLAAALAVLVRPHVLPSVLGAMALICARRSDGRLRMCVAFIVPVVLGAVAFVLLSGGPGPLWYALKTHGAYHFSRLGQAEHDLAGSGIARSLGHPAVAAMWLCLFLVGLVRLARHRRWTSASPIVLGALLPLVVLIHGLSNPAHSRYAVPLLALSCGPVAAGVSAVFRRWTAPVIGAVAVGTAAVALPQILSYRSTISPPVAAVDAAIAEASHIGGVVVADRKLHAFFVLRERARPSPAAVLFDHMIELGRVPPPPPERTVYVVDTVDPSLLVNAVRQRTFSCTIPLVRTLGQDRYLDLVVAVGARLLSHPDEKASAGFIDPAIVQSGAPSIGPDYDPPHVNRQPAAGGEHQGQAGQTPFCP